MPLMQLHHEFRSGRTEFVAQTDPKSLDEVQTWLKDVQPRHPLPEGATWMICTEESEHFVMTEAEEEDIG